MPNAPVLPRVVRNVVEEHRTLRLLLAEVERAFARTSPTSNRALPAGAWLRRCTQNSMLVLATLVRWCERYEPTRRIPVSSATWTRS